MSSHTTKHLVRNIIVYTCLMFSSVGHAQTTDIRQEMLTGNTRWVSAFALTASADKVVIRINISLLPAGEVNRVALKEKTALWKAAIDDTWNDRFYVESDDGESPIHFDVRFTHRDPHHRVVIHPGRWNPDQHNWYINTPPSIVAHEIGHMIGAYDEYRGGALSSDHPLIDTKSIMGSRAERGTALPRHLQLVKRALVEQFGDIEIRTRQLE
mgnify:CR=1 FL=1